MRFPSKVTTYKESTIPKFPVVLSYLEKSDMAPGELYKKVKNKVTDVREYMEILDCLYTLNKIELREEMLHYVG